MTERRQTLSLTDPQLRELEEYGSVDAATDDGISEFTVTTVDVGGARQLLLRHDQYRELLTGTPAAFHFGKDKVVLQRATIPAGPFTLMVTPWDEPADDPTGQYAMQPGEPQRYWDTPNTFDDFAEATRHADLEQSRSATDQYWIADAAGNNVYPAPAAEWYPPVPRSFDSTPSRNRR